MTTEQQLTLYNNNVPSIAESDLGRDSPSDRLDDLDCRGAGRAGGTSSAAEL